MGYALAEAAVEAGHDVILVSGPVTLDPPKGARLIRVTSAAQMAAASKKAFSRCDAAIFTAAVCDYRPKRRAKRKLAKADHPKSVDLVNTEDIAASLGRVKGSRVTMAFAMETHSGRKHAESKLIRKKCDAIVLNGPENVGKDCATVELLIRDAAWRRFPTGGKRGIARRLIRVVERMMLAQESKPDQTRRRR